MKLKNRAPKIRRICENQLSIEFEKSDVTLVKLRLPKNPYPISANFLSHKQKFIIKLCED